MAVSPAIPVVILSKIQKLTDIVAFLIYLAILTIIVESGVFVNYVCGSTYIEPHHKILRRTITSHTLQIDIYL